MRGQRPLLEREETKRTAGEESEELSGSLAGDDDLQASCKRQTERL